MQHRALGFRIACGTGALLLGLAAGPARSAPITVSDPFLQLFNVGVNSLGNTPGSRIRYGATTVTPNGAGGTTGTATTRNTVTNAPVNRTIVSNPSPLLPGFFSGSIAYNANLLGPWTLSFANNVTTPNTTTIPMTLPAGAQQVPFINNITLSGTSDNPTFTWTPPPGVTVNGYRLNIYDKSLINNDPNNGPLNSGQVTNLNVAPNVTSHTVTASDFTVPGYGFTLGKNYSLEISLLQTRDGSSTALNNNNVFALSRVYADFTPLAGGSPLVNLPVVNIDGSYQFNISVVPGQTYYLDPEVAIGYVFETGVGDPNFRSVLLPTNIGDGKYDIYGFDGNGNPILLAHDWLGGAIFDFGNGGVSIFEILGIETSAGLDPNSTTAFITGLTFTGSGLFTGTQTPITTLVDAPEPSTLGIIGAALGLLGLARRRH